MTDEGEVSQGWIDRRLVAYYGSEFDEADRLVGRSGQGVPEFERTQEMIRDRVPAGSSVIDIGGATGVHAAALAVDGTATLRDPVPLTWQRLIGEGSPLHAFLAGTSTSPRSSPRSSSRPGSQGWPCTVLKGPPGLPLDVSRSLESALLDAARVLATAFGHQPGFRDLSPHLLAIGTAPAA